MDLKGPLNAWGCMEREWEKKEKKERKREINDKTINDGGYLRAPKS